MRNVPAVGACVCAALVAPAAARAAGENGAAVPPSGQTKAGNNEPQTSSLGDYLSKVGERWSVSFIFDSRIVRGKTVSIPDSAAFPEDQLSQQLRSQGLVLQKIKDRIYAIKRSRPNLAAPAPLSPVAAASNRDEVIVVGSRIPQANAISASPVTTISAVDFDIRGAARVEDLVNTLPQAFAAQGANTSNGATGTAQVDLRGLGSVRTLVLVNGHRLQYGSAFFSSAPDLNQVPAALVQRVDVLTGGASAVYGSDAVSGVVNFVMLKDFEGVRIEGQISGYQHANKNKLAQEVLNRADVASSFNSDFSIPKHGVFDGKGQNITLILGANTEDGRGNVTAYAGYRYNDPILEADRDYAKCALSGGDPTFVCLGSATSPNGAFITRSGVFTLDESTGDTFRASDVFTNSQSADRFNFNPTNFYQRPDLRYTIGSFAHYEVNDNLEFYSELMFYDYHSDAQIAFTGSFFTTSQINCDNPLMSSQQATLVCGDDAGDPNVDALFYPGKRFVESKPRNDSIRLTSYRMLAGVRGDAPGLKGWKYDAYFQYGNTHNAQIYENDAVVSKIQNALFVEIDNRLDSMGNPVNPATFGTPQCRVFLSGADPSCVPLNLFTIGGVTQAQLNYILQDSFQDGDTKQYLGDISLTGDFGQYGVQSPWSEDGVGFAIGMQWRKDKLAYHPDALFEFGLLASQGSPRTPVSGEIETTDFYVEAQLPLVSGMAFAERVAINGGYRRSQVSLSGDNSTWKLMADWQVTPEIRLRGGWQRAIRAANVIEAFLPQTIVQTTFPILPNGETDPCAGPTPARTFADCARTGVTAAQYTHIMSSSTLQYNVLTGGNANLDPERSNTYTAGIVLSPNEYAPGNLLFSVDYFDIKVDGFIATVPATTTLNRCLDTGDPYFCNAIHRSRIGGSLFAAQGNFIDAFNVNTGYLSTRGVDFNANWSAGFSQMGLGDIGRFKLDFVGTYLIDLKTLTLPDGSLPEYDCAGWFGGRCGGPNPAWRHTLQTTWQTPIGVDATVSWRYVSSVKDGDSVVGALNPNNLNFKLGRRSYIDVAASVDVTENWTVRVGVNNLLDKDPPLTAEFAGFSNGNTYPQTYDAMGRFLFIGATIDF